MARLAYRWHMLEQGFDIFRGLAQFVPFRIPPETRIDIEDKSRPRFVVKALLTLDIAMQVRPTVDGLLFKAKWSK